MFANDCCLPLFYLLSSLPAIHFCPSSEYVSDFPVTGWTKLMGSSPFHVLLQTKSYGPTSPSSLCLCGRWLAGFRRCFHTGVQPSIHVYQGFSFSNHQDCPAGFLPRWAVIPDYWIWYGYLNPLRYAWGALMINCFEGRGVKVTGIEVRLHGCHGFGSG